MKYFQYPELIASKFFGKVINCYSQKLPTLTSNCQGFVCCIYRVIVIRIKGQRKK